MSTRLWEHEGEVPFIEVPQPKLETRELEARSGAIAEVSFRLPALVHPDHSTANPRLVVWHDPKGPAAEQYRQVREHFLSQVFARQARTVLLGSPGGTNSATAAVNLALALAEWGLRRVVLIETEPTTPSAASLLSLSESAGWADLLVGMPLEQALQETGWYGLHLIAAGRRLVAARPGKHSERIERLLEELKARYDLVLFRSLAAWGGGFAAAHACDAGCFLLGKDQVGQPAETLCLEALGHHGIPALGSVIISD